jgi:type IV pilus assembly protein PilQ
MPGGSSGKQCGVQTGTECHPEILQRFALRQSAGAGSFNGCSPGVFSFLLFNDRGTKFLNLELSALQADGKGKIISSPRVITADKVEATSSRAPRFRTSRQLPAARPACQFKKATLSLRK